MDVPDAVALLRPLVHQDDAAWADVGAGDGTFTQALATLLGPSATIHALDRDPAAVRGLRALERSARPADGATIVVAQADLMDLPPLPPLDGILLGNVLHYVRKEAQADALIGLAALLTPQGRIAVIEYDNRAANRWVPFPVSRQWLADLARVADLRDPVVTATRPSAYGGLLYVARLERRVRPSALP